MIGKLTFKYFTVWLIVLTMPIGFGVLVQYVDYGVKDFWGLIITIVTLYIFFGFIGLVGSFILAVGSVGAETAGNVLKDVEKYNASKRK